MKRQLSADKWYRRILGMSEGAFFARPVRKVLLLMLLSIPTLVSAIELQVSPNPSNCPSSGRLNFSVSDLMPGSPGPVGTPPSVVFHIWSTSGLTIAGSSSHTSFATAYTTSDLSLGGLTAGNYTVRAVESYGSETASSTDVNVTVVDAFGDTPDFEINVNQGYCEGQGIITANVTQGTLTEFRLIDAVTGVVVIDWQSSNTFRNLPVGSYIVQGRDNCPSPTVAAKGNYQIIVPTNNTYSFIKSEQTACNTYTFQPGVHNDDNWLSFPINVTYSITEDGNPVVSNATAGFNAPDGISTLTEKLLDIPYASYDRTKSYTFTATGTDACGKTYSWTQTVEANRPHSTRLVQNCSNVAVRDVFGFVGDVTWNFTAYPAGFTQITGTATPDIFGNLTTFSGLPAGDYVVEFADSCGHVDTKTINVPVDCVEGCVENEFYVYSQQIVQGCGPEKVVVLTFAREGIGVEIYKAEIIAAPGGYSTGPFPIDIPDFTLDNGFTFKFTTLVPGDYTFRLSRLGPCSEPYAAEIPINVPDDIMFSNFNIDLDPSCGVNTIQYSYIYNATGPLAAAVTAAVLERKTANGWETVTTASASALSGSFPNIDVAGTYRVRVQRTHQVAFDEPVEACPGVYEYSNQLTVGGTPFPSFKESYGMTCASNNGLKVVIVGGQNGRPWPDGYKYKITHVNGTPYTSGSVGYDAAYAEYDFRSTFTLPDGTYTFSLIDVCGNEISRELDITSLGIPQVRNITTCENSQNAVTLSVDYFDGITYEWYKVVGTPGGGDDVLMSSTNELKFVPYTSTHAGDYYVRITLPGVSCQVADIPYTLAPQSNPVSGSTEYPCSGTGYFADIRDPEFSLNSLLGSDAQPGGTWTSTSTPTSTGWSGSTFTPTQSQKGTFTFTYTVEGIAEGACGTVASASTCVKIVVEDKLPVTLVSFTATAHENAAELSWVTSEETNSDRFEIQRSTNGKGWEKVGTVAAQGESKVKKAYAFSDRKPKAGENLYRLKMVDFDNTFAFSAIRSLRFESKLASSIYPNPVMGELTLKVSSWDQVKQVRIDNLAGLQVYSSGPVATGKLDVSRLDAGVYILRITHLDGSVHAHKFVHIK